MTDSHSVSVSAPTSTSTSVLSQTGAPSTTHSRPYIPLSKLFVTFLVLILIIASALVWSTHLHPTFLFTVLTCFITFVTLSYQTFSPSIKNAAPASSPTRLHTTLHLLLLHILPLLLWLTSMVLLSSWTHTYQTTTWRSGTRLDAEKTYLAALPPGLTPVRIATDHFRRRRTGKYIAAVKIVGVCAGLAGLMMLLCAVEVVRFGLELHKAAPSPERSANRGIGDRTTEVTERILRCLASAFTRRGSAALPVTEQDAKSALEMQQHQDENQVVAGSRDESRHGGLRLPVLHRSDRWETASHVSEADQEQNQREKDMISPTADELVGVDEKDGKASSGDERASKKGWFSFLAGNTGSRVNEKRMDAISWESLPRTLWFKHRK